MQMIPTQYQELVQSFLEQILEEPSRSMTNYFWVPILLEHLHQLPLKVYTGIVIPVSGISNVQIVFSQIINFF